MRGYAWVPFVAARHLRTRRRERGHTAGVLAIGGIAAGVMTLVTVLGVMNGFQLGTIENILEVGSFHLQVTSDSPARAVGDLAGGIAAVPGVRASAAYADTFGLLSGYFPDPLAVLVRALPPDLHDRDERFAANLGVVSGSFRIGEPDSIVLGEELARRIGVRVGDRVHLMSFADGDVSLSAPGATPLEVVAVFRSGFLEYDSGWSFVSLETGEALGFGRRQTVGVKLVDRFADRQVAAAIARRFPGVSISSWRDYNRSIFGALRLEKTLMMLLIGLIFVVVAVNIFQSLRRSVVERTEEIGVLKALGASPGMLRAVFMLEGLLIGFAGASVGMLLGIAVSLNVNELFGAAEILVNGVGAAVDLLAAFLGGEAAGRASYAIFSPSYFYLERVPTQLMVGELVGIHLFAVGSATVAAWGASRRVSSIVPAEVLRYE